MIPPMIGNLIVIAALVAVAALAVRSIWKGHIFPRNKPERSRLNA